MNSWRIAGVALMVGLALFLLSVVVKLLLIAAVTAIIINVVGKQIARRYYGPLNRGQWPATRLISIDNPTGVVASAHQFGRIIPIN